jgi:hypothetical protein
MHKASQGRGSPSVPPLVSLYPSSFWEVAFLATEAWEHLPPWVLSPMEHTPGVGGGVGPLAAERLVL